MWIFGNRNASEGSETPVQPPDIFANLRPRPQPQLNRYFVSVKEALSHIELGILRDKLPPELRSTLNRTNLPGIFGNWLESFLLYLGNCDGIFSPRESDLIFQVLDASSYYDLREYHRRLSNKFDAFQTTKESLTTSFVDFVALCRASSLLEDGTLESIFNFVELAGLRLISIDGNADEKEVEELSDLAAAIKGEVLRQATHAQKTTEKTNSLDGLVGEIHELVGLQNVKREITQLINLARVRKMRQEAGMAIPSVSLHLVFTGNPGTGKTTVARLLSSIYKHLGLLTNGHLVEADRSSLVAGYVGQTALKTREVLDRAKGGILFIDEAYSLSSSRDSADYGREVIDTILKFMEDNRDDFILVVAGYSEKMSEFLNSNPGLRSRFNKFISFADYAPDELGLIFERLANASNYRLTPDAKNEAQSQLIALHLRRNSSFGNAREVRNFFENVMANQADRIAALPNPSEDQLAIIEKTDIPTVG